MEYTIDAYLSTVTGNTKKLAEGVKNKLKEQGICLNLHENENFQPDNMENELILIFFWCRRSTLNPESKVFLEKWKGKRVIAIGTMGGYPDSEYGNRVRKNVRTDIEKENYCEGIFLSQGKIDEQSTAHRRSLSPENPHYLNDEAYERHLESRKHPNQEDIDGAFAFLLERLTKTFL
ncbi:MAG: flavodoxin family protein [Lachnospiraceae bacterium]|nr:flavodoxin family protein [Lachnospiraceae bacterium]